MKLANGLRLGRRAIDPVADRYRRYRRSIATAAAIFAVVLILVSGLSTWRQRERALNTAEVESRNLSLALSELVARSLESVDILLRSIREVAALGELTDPAITLQLHEASNERILGVPQVRALVTIDRGGTIAAFSRWHPAPRIDVRDRDYFVALRGASADALFIGVPTLNRVNGEWTINVARRISGPDGTFNGVVLATLEPLHYEEIFAAINLTPGGTVAMFREDGVLLARHPHAEAMMGQAIGDTPFRRRLGRSSDPVVVRAAGGIDGSQRIIAGRFLQSFPVYVSVSQAQDVVLASWGYDAALGAAALAAVLLALGAVTALLLHQTRQRESAERDLVAARLRAETANRAKSAFLAGMSHELRTPLNAIIGFAEMLDTQIFGPLANDKQREYVRDIHASGSHLRDLVGDILDLAKIEAGKWELECVPVDVTDAFDGVATIMHGLAATGGVRLAHQPASPAIEVFADPVVLRQMLINLVGNAIKFTKPGGDVAMSAKRNGNVCDLTVSDNGVGIAPGDLQRVMQPFEQGDIARPRAAKDSGLGLALTKAFAELHGGRLAIASRTGVGTAVTITLPIADPGRSQRPAA